jgi:hypothetical protein
MDTAKPFGDDLDLDALMARIREAASSAGTGTPPRQNGSSDAKHAESDLVRVLDAQGEWNEHTRQSLAALVECLRTLRDDWTDAHTRLQDEVRRLSAKVARLQSGRKAAARRVSRRPQRSTKTRRRRS